jgi:hypothetical protein
MDAAALTKPLTEMTRKNVTFLWTAEHQLEECFEKIKRRILRNQKLAFVDFTLPTFVRTDASKLGCGAQLLQVVNGRERTVSYLLKAFTPTDCTSGACVARLLHRAIFDRSTADDAASGRAGASGAAATFLSMRVCVCQCTSAAVLL